jgi:hypothetical protein
MKKYLHWELEDQLTHEVAVFRRQGEWCIGREVDPDATSKIMPSTQTAEFNPQEQEKVLVPITQDYAKCRKLLSSFVLSKVSREHGLFGIDDRGPYFIDLSTNGTTLKDGAGYRLCEKETRNYLADGVILYLAASYPLCLRRHGRLREWIARVKRFFIKSEG